MDKYYKIISVFCLWILFLCNSCASVNSQKVNSGNIVDSNEQNTSQHKETGKVKDNDIPNAPDNYKIAKKGAEELNAEPLPPSSAYRKVKPLPRESIRQALIQLKLGAESDDGKVGGGKVVHFSHTCNLFVDNKVFYVVHAPVIIQLASFARWSNHVLVFDDSMSLIHDLVVDDPLFCDGNRLFFNDYEMTVPSNKKGESDATGNVLIFTNDAKDFKAKIASLNFYRFKNLIH